jgi:hypothetical protein
MFHLSVDETPGVGSDDPNCSGVYAIWTGRGRGACTRQGRGRDFFAVACDHDLEGIVAKPAHGLYHSDGRHTNWLKIKNPHYPQSLGRHELFDSHGVSTPTPTNPPLLALGRTVRLEDRGCRPLHTIT